MEFKEGDLVQLKSGGPSMTVETVGDNYGIPTAWCVWFESVGSKQVLKKEAFKPVVLKSHAEPTSMSVGSFRV